MMSNHRAGGRADNADALRVSGQGDFSLSAEQTFGAEFFFQGIKCQAQCAIACGLDGVQDQLIIATAFKQRHFATHFDGQPVLECLAYPRRVVAKQRTTHLGAAVFEREVNMA